MKWKILKDGADTGKRIEMQTHDAALRGSCCHFPFRDHASITVEPCNAEGKCHDNRFYSQTGPVLTPDQL